MNKQELLQQSLDYLVTLEPILKKKIGEISPGIMKMLEDTLRYGFDQGELCGYYKGLKEGAEETVKILEKKARENVTSENG